MRQDKLKFSQYKYHYNREIHALKIREKYFGKVHINVAVTLDNLAGVYKALGDTKQAQLTLNRAVLIKKFHKNGMQNLLNNGVNKGTLVK